MPERERKNYHSGGYADEDREYLWNTAEEESGEDVYAASAVRRRNGEMQSHFTKRDPSRRQERERRMAQRRAEISNSRSSQDTPSAAFSPVDWLIGLLPSDKAVSAAQRKSRRHSSGAAVSSSRARYPSGAAGRKVSAKGGSSGKSGLSLRKAVIAAVCVLAVLSIAVTAAQAAYRSKSVFNESPLDDSAIQERLITEEANQAKVTYFLIAGVDKSSKLTDCIWVLCFDNAAHKMNVMQIPRDTYVGKDSLSPHKINAVYANPKTVNWCEECGRAVTAEEVRGEWHTVCSAKLTRRKESNINALIRCINNRLRLPVDHYVLFDFEGFSKVVDAMGGVDIYLENELRVYPNKHDYETLPAGDNHLDGRMTLNFMRNRQAYADGDLGRVKAQRSIIHAMMTKTKALTPLEMLSLLRAAYGNFSTDMSVEEIRSFIAPVRQCDDDALTMFTMPGSVYWEKPNPSYYLCNPQETADAINEYLMPYGTPLTAEDVQFPTLQS